MGRIILDLAMSLDGFIEGKYHEVDWILFDDEIGNDLLEFSTEIDTVLYGRASYERFGNYEPEASAGYFERLFYKKVNTLSKYVFSSTLSKDHVEATVINGDIRKQVNKIKKNAKKDIWLFGGAGLAATLLDHGLIDEIRIGLNPVLLGAGIPLFKEINNRKNLKLLRTKIYPSGVVGLYYKPF